MLSLQLICDDRSLQESTEGVQKLEFAKHGRTVVKCLRNDRTQTSLEHFDSASKLVKVIVELFRTHIDHVVRNLLECSDRFGEV